MENERALVRQTSKDKFVVALEKVKKENAERKLAEQKAERERQAAALEYERKQEIVNRGPEFSKLFIELSEDSFEINRDQLARFDKDALPELAKAIARRTLPWAILQKVGCYLAPALGCSINLGFLAAAIFLQFEFMLCLIPGMFLLAIGFACSEQFDNCKSLRYWKLHRALRAGEGLENFPREELQKILPPPR